MLKSTEEAFLVNGFHNTTTAQIAANAGRSTGSIYAHFPSKESL